MNSRDLRIVFMGTPEFAAHILKKLIEENYNIVGVVTAPDKPAGRGQKIQEPEVKKYAQTQNLKILQPEKLKDPKFVEELKAINADIQVVIAFRMLPEIIWQMPVHGTFNLHASLLPQYRGAAPINWAIINGEKRTGLTSFLIDKEIDTGKIIAKKEIDIEFTDTAGSLHDKMIMPGAELVIETIETIAQGKLKAIPQEMFIEQIIHLKVAPKIFKNDCRINWENEGLMIYNFIRGMSPFPCSWTELHNMGGEKPLSLKIYEAEWISEQHQKVHGSLLIEKNKLFVAVMGGYIKLKSIQLEGKKRLLAEEFLNGFKFDHHYLK